MQRHSKGLMIGGIVLVSLAPVGFAVALMSSLSKGLCSIDNPDRQGCDGYDTVTTVALIGGLGCVAAGVPMIVIGAKKEPADPWATATVSPWATRNAAGLGLRIEM
jgi:hypothetical protein